MNLLELKSIKKYFWIKKHFLKPHEESVKAVDQVDLTIQKGENLSLVGESGSGKTTLGRIILQLYLADQGQIILNGTDLRSLSKKQLRLFRKDMQMVFQDPFSSLDPRYPVYRIIMEGMIFEKNMPKQKKIQRVRELLTAVDLKENMMYRFPHEFSGGERQRIAIARALAMNPKLLILDEAVSSLDVLIQQQIIELLLSLQKRFDVTYLLISHNLRVVKKISKKIAVMYKGKIVEYGDVDEIFHNPIHLYTQELLAAAIHYKAVDREEDIVIPSEARLVDHGNGHFVIGLEK
jgi:peptide/nickel transport system ATP-binding protein/oligopeptide transport system ATP-binding protein